MWNVYNLIKNRTINPVILESSLDREIRESEERSQKYAEEQLNMIPRELRELELGLIELEKTTNEEKLWKIANDADINSRMITFHTISGMLSPKVKEYYGKAIQALQKASEVLGKYSELDCFSDFSRDRADNLIELKNKYGLGIK